MDEFNLESRVKMMSQYLDPEAIAEALHLTPEVVEDILNGKAVIQEKQPKTIRDTNVIQVKSVRTAYRQKIISIVRSKGGVGATSVALGLSLVFSSGVKTLLVPLLLDVGLGDIMQVANSVTDSLQPALRSNGPVSLKSNLDVLEIVGDEITEQKIANIGEYARRNYDVAVFDLPNNNHHPAVIEAVNQSTTIVAVTSGHIPEMVRLSSFLQKYPNKEIFLVANMCSDPKIEGLADLEKVKLDFDPSMNTAFREGDFPGMRFSFMKGMSRLKDLIYEEQRRSLLQRIFAD